MMQTLRCNLCSTPIPLNGRYCPKCGSSSFGAAAEAADAGPASAVSAPVTPSARVVPISPTAPARQVPIRSAPLHPTKAPLPRIGKIFFGLFALAIALMWVGFAKGLLIAGFAGVGLLIVLILLVLIGDSIF